MSLNRSKRGELTFFYEAGEILADWSTVLDRGSVSWHWPLASRCQQLGNLILFPFLALERWENLTDSFSNFLGYIRMITTQLGQHEKPRIEERVKKKRRPNDQFQISALLLQFSTLFTSSSFYFFFLVSFYNS